MIGINELQPQTLETLTTEILILKRQTAQNIIEIGKRLLRAKEMVGHGNWLAYLEEKVEFSERTARNFMRAASEFSNRQSVADLEPSKVYLLLEAPPDKRDALAEQAADMTKRELEEAVREANRAKREADEAKRRAAEAEAKAKELANRPPQVVERTVEVVKPDPELARKHAEMRQEYDQLVGRLGKVTRELDASKSELSLLKQRTEADWKLTEEIRKKEAHVRELTDRLNFLQAQFDDGNGKSRNGPELMRVISPLDRVIYGIAVEVKRLRNEGVGGFAQDDEIAKLAKKLREVAGDLETIVKDRASAPITIASNGGVIE